MASKSDANPASETPITGICHLVCTEDKCPGLQDCMHMPGLIYLPSLEPEPTFAGLDVSLPQSAPALRKGLNVQQPQSAFEMAPWAVYPSGSNALQRPPPPLPPIKRSAKSTQRTPRRRSVSPKTMKSVQRARRSSCPTKTRLIQALQRSLSPPAKPVQPIQPTPQSPPPAKATESALPTQPTEPTELVRETEAPQLSSEGQMLLQQPQTQQMQEIGLQPEFQFPEEWATMMTPPPLTWGLPYTDSPPYGDLEIPEELLEYQYQNGQQQQQPASHQDTIPYGTPFVDDFIQSFLLHDTLPEDEQGWYEFLSASGENNVSTGMPRLSDDVLDDDRWYINMDFVGGGYMSGLGGKTLL